MLDPKRQAEADQAFATLADQYPKMWRRLYEGLLESGFGPSEAFKLLQTYILAQCPFGIRGDDG